MKQGTDKRTAACFGLLIVLGSGVGGYPAAPRRLTPAEANVCHAQGGYESFSPKGLPYCQFRYGDGGTTCSGKADCQGNCLFSLDGVAVDPNPGDAVTGKCEAERGGTDGCYAGVEGGRLSADKVCVN